MTRILSPVLTTGLLLLVAACSSTKKEEPTTTELRQGRNVELSSDNVFAWKKEDVERGENNEITGGKRSRYDKRTASSFGKKGSKTPDYYSKNYQAKAWSGGRDYSKGSYKTKSWGGGKDSRFSGKNSREARRQANASAKSFKTGKYGTSSARERVHSAVNHTKSSYGDKRWGYKPPIFTYDEYRQLSIGQTRSLLGKD